MPLRLGIYAEKKTAPVKARLSYVKGESIIRFSYLSRERTVCGAWFA